MPDNVSTYNPAAETFPAYLRRQADNHDRMASIAAEGSLYPPAWWRGAAEADRKLADDIDRIHGSVQ